MSLYNMLFGRNPASELLLAMLDLTPAAVGRFRDCYPNDDGTRIIVYTRNGGGNREEYQPLLDTLSKHPNWLSDRDDDFDCTYCYIEFSVPQQFAEAVKKIADSTDTRSPADKWKTLLDDMQNGKDNATVSRALEVGKKIFGAVEEGKSGTVTTTEGSMNIITVPKKPRK